jgi:hypothetical protein
MIVEVDNQPLCTKEELLCTPQGEVMLLNGARSFFDLNRDYNDTLLAVRKEKAASRSDDELRATIRKIAGVRKLEDIPVLHQKNVPASTAVAASKRMAYLSENGNISLLAVHYVPKTSLPGTIIYLNSTGKTGSTDCPDRIKELAAEGKTVVAVDLRGLGRTQSVDSLYYDHDLFGTDGVSYYFAYLLGKSYVGMRTEDLLAVAREQHRSVEIVAEGEVAGLVALHAAALEPGLIAGVKLDMPIRTWYDVVKAGCSPYPITNIVHGALLEYDVPDLLRLAKERIIE